MDAAGGSPSLYVAQFRDAVITQYTVSHGGINWKGFGSKRSSPVYAWKMMKNHENLLSQDSNTGPPEC
jgi:hypothetical protein